MIALLAGTIVTLLYKIKVQHANFCKDGSILPVCSGADSHRRIYPRRDGEYHCVLTAQVMLTRVTPQPSEELIIPPFPIFK